MYFTYICTCLYEYVFLSLSLTLSLSLSFHFLACNAMRAPIKGNIVRHHVRLWSLELRHELAQESSPTFPVLRQEHPPNICPSVCRLGPTEPVFKLPLPPPSFEAPWVQAILFALVPCLAEAPPRQTPCP